MSDTEYIQTINKSLDSIEGSITYVKDNYEKLNDRQTALEKSVQDLYQRNDHLLDVEGTGGHGTLGNAFTKSAEFRNFKTNRHAAFEFATKSASTSATANGVTVNTVAPGFFAGVAAAPDKELVIENLIPHVPTVSDSVQYMVGGALDNKAAIAPETTLKAESSVGAPALKKCDIVTFAHWTKIAAQMAADSPALAAYINQKMQYGLQEKIDYQIINGTGTDQLAGILTEGNYTDNTAAIRKVLPSSGATLLDFVLILKSQMQKAGITPKVLLLNPSDFLQLALLKDKQGKYMIGDPNSGAVASLWGLPIVSSDTIPEGKYICADFNLGATVYDRQLMTVEMSAHDADNFERNLYTLRVERRMSLAVELPQAIWAGDFSLTAAA